MRGTQTYRMPRRRRREQRTDYRARLTLLKGNKPRLVVRKSGNNLTCQVISHDPQGDKTLVTATCLNLRKLGWKGHGGSIPSAYLVGYVCGKEAKKKGVTEAIPDLGLYPSTKGSRLYAALKGAVDGGLNVPHSKEILPPSDRIAGKHIAAYAEKLKSNHERFASHFSAYLKNKLEPATLPQHFEEIKRKIV